MLVTSLEIGRAEFESGTGWDLKPEGACKGEVCIPLRETPGDTVDVASLAEQMGLPVVADSTHGLWAIGPESIGARALATAEAPELCLPDMNGNEFRLSSLRGQKVLVYAWAPY